jgi:ABC-2 type transport system permease protein
VVEAVQVVLLIAIALALGWTAGPSASVPLVLAGLIGGTVAFAGLGLLMAGTLRAEATLALANLLFLLSLVLGGIVLPLDRLPGPVAAIASDLPPATLTRVLTIGLGGPGDVTEPLILLTGWAALFAILAARTFRWD